MSKVPAEVTVDWNGGAHSYGGGPRGTFVLDAQVEFSGKFCSIHPGTQIEYEEDYSGNGQQEKRYYCRHCRDAFNDRFKHLLSEARFKCGNLEHEHECRCWIGHDCDTDPCWVQAKLKRESVDENGNPVEPNAMEVLGAEAPTEAMLGITQRLARLEEENRALKSVVLTLVGQLPEEAREALGCTEVLLGPQSPASD